jgi:hypothetical protein
MTDQPQNPNAVEAEISTMEAPPPVPPARRRFFRYTLIVFAVALFIAFAVYLVLSAQRATFNSPIAYDPFPGAELKESSISKNEDAQTYTTPATIGQVFEFYSSRFGRMTADQAERGCRKIFTSEPLNDSNPNFQVRCVIDNSQGEVSQLLQITAFIDQPSGLTYIFYKRVWGS